MEVIFHSLLIYYQAPNIEVWIDDNQVMLIDEEYTIYNVKNNIKVY